MRPYHVAIVGSGPSGFFAAASLLKAADASDDINVAVDMLEMLPTPWGLVRSGVASVEDVDKAIRNGPGLRWAVMGPHLVYHLGGGAAGIHGHMAHLAKTKEGMLRDLASWTAFPADAVELVASGLEVETGEKSLAELEAERDEMLAALLLALREARRSDETPQ